MSFTRIGIVGCGNIAPTHIKALQNIKKYNVVSVCDISKEKAEVLANKYNIPKAYTDFSLMLQQEKLDIVDILTPPQVHAAQSIEAMEAGCHVVVEKPMCESVEEADQMIKAAKINNVKLSVVHSFLFTPGIRKALNAVKQGKIGDLLWVDTIVSIYPLLKWKKYMYKTWYEDLHGGVFGEIIPHGLYTQLGFLGNVKNLSCIAKKSEQDSTLTPFSEMHVGMECENGIGGLLMSSRIISAYTLIMVRVVGSHQTILVNVPSATAIKMKSPDTNSMFTRFSMNIQPALQLISESAVLGTKTLRRAVKAHMTHEIFFNAFLESIEKNSPPPVTPEEGREVVRVTNMVFDTLLK